MSYGPYGMVPNGNIPQNLHKCIANTWAINSKIVEFRRSECDVWKKYDPYIILVTLYNSIISSDFDYVKQIPYACGRLYSNITCLGQGLNSYDSKVLENPPFISMNSRRLFN